MQVRDCMTRSVQSVQATETIGEVARFMADTDIGVVPILDRDRLTGIVTDRDIAVRGVGGGFSRETPVARIMSDTVVTCSPDDDLDHALSLMAREQVRRLPVCDQRRMLVGIISLADAVETLSGRDGLARVFADISRPCGDHCQTAILI